MNVGNPLLRTAVLALVVSSVLLLGCPPVLPTDTPGAYAENETGDSLRIVSFDPSLPAIGANAIAFGSELWVTVEYNVESVDAARIFVRPLTDGELTPGYVAHSSPEFTGSGQMEGWVSFNEPAEVDQVRVVMTNSEQTKTLLTLILNIQAEWNGI